LQPGINRATTESSKPKQFQSFSSLCKVEAANQPVPICMRTGQVSDFIIRNLTTTLWLNRWFQTAYGVETR
jgi:hypothetical protein